MCGTVCQHARAPASSPEKKGICEEPWCSEIDSAGSGLLWSSALTFVAVIQYSGRKQFGEQRVFRLILLDLRKGSQAGRKAETRDMEREGE